MEVRSIIQLHQPVAPLAIAFPGENRVSQEEVDDFVSRLLDVMHRESFDLAALNQESRQ